ncbi:hypothetical protein [Rhabdothermincola sediminis]|uniref:hypothetical protein n=1 Tax=Rhabdothermincola sediminis TaxID=2751370 RepID=UPI001AA07E7D|nr:hypothetical protein [Rhabdothermincola sediminis]
MPSFRRRPRTGKSGSTRPESSAPLTDEAVVDLRDPLPPGNLEWGLPTLCPRCEAWGYIDRLDLVQRVMQLHCPTCLFRWEISEAQIEAVKAARAGTEPADPGA